VSDTRILALFEGYLRQRADSGTPLDLTDHLDEDALTAFTEGNLTKREADPLVLHLSDCSFCRHRTAELVRFDLAFGDTEASRAAEPDRKPSKVSDVLSGILSGLFGGKEAVFAHEDTKSDDKHENSDKESENEEK
jgi:hypothetical protein